MSYSDKYSDANSYNKNSRLCQNRYHYYSEKISIFMVDILIKIIVTMVNTFIEVQMSMMAVGVVGITGGRERREFYERER